MIRFELQQDLRKVFRALGKTVVMVTHDLAEAAYFGDVVVLLRNGRIIQSASVGLSEFVRAPADPFVTQFLNAQGAHSDGTESSGP
jgi:osmoprotectant transport system ATP-binding protein